jgi:cbb3-type cytochrome oxidase subunit 3
VLLQIILGVVIGGLILKFLPEVLALGLFGIIAFIGLAIVGATLYWLHDNPVAIFIIGLVGVGIFLYRRHEKIKFDKSTAGAIQRLENQIDQRRAMGYDTEEQRNLLNALRSKLNTEKEATREAEWSAIESSPEYRRKIHPKPPRISDKARAKERERRKELGYDK